MMSNESPKHRTAPRAALALALLGILILGSAFRFYNVNWDEGTYHIHPDERHTTMVVSRIQWPESLVEYFDTSHSPLNARNQDTVYFYGTLPLFLTKAVAGQLDALAPHVPLLDTDQSYESYDRVHLVGRVLSALFDLGSVLLTFFLGRRLFGWRVGLIAAFLLAVTVLNIQGSHYFAVDTFLTFFVILTIWFTLDVAEYGGWPSFLGLGLSMGLTLACKVSVFLLVVVVALGAWVRVRRRLLAGGEGTRALLGTTTGLVLAVITAVAVFRVAQPYAWAGPNYDGWEGISEGLAGPFEVFRALPEPLRAVIMPNPRWLDDISSAGAQQTGEADLPWGRQWTERVPWLWPLENMVLWTLGVPLGVSAWAGVLLALAAVVLGWRRQQRVEGAVEATGQGASPPRRGGLANWDLVLIPLAWVLLTFGWQGMQYVKSVRYFLPIHPYLAVFAAWLGVAAWDWARGRAGSARLRPWLRLAAGGLAAVVVVGTLAWALAFIQIYSEPVTRVQATEWIYENVPSGATLHYTTPEGEPGQLQLPLPSTQVYATDGGWIITPFTPPHSLTATEIVMNELSGTKPVQGAFEVQISSGEPGQALAQAEIRGILGENGPAGTQEVLDISDALLEAGQTYQLESRALEGAPLIASAAKLHGRAADGQDVELTISLSPDHLYATDRTWHVVSFTSPQDMTAMEVVMVNLRGAHAPQEGVFEVRISSASEPVTEAQVRGTFGAPDHTDVRTASEGGQKYVLDIADVALEGGQTYYFESRALEGAPLVSYGSVIANEHFDDPLPFNMFGYAAFGSGLYRSLDVAYPGSADRIDQLSLYDEDTREKLEVLLDALDQADYIMMSSGRLWQSIPRLPMRYPMTTRYYELLFAEKLGFELAAEFHSYPRLFGIEFDDTWAEEQFTVYDHPRVHIFRKTAGYDREEVRALLSEGIDWETIPHWLNPRDVPEWRREQAQQQRTGESQNALMLTAEERQIQEQGGTWASIFDRNSLASRWPTLTWLLLLAAVGLATLPLTLAVFGRLPDGGWILARPVGVLLLAWLSWMLTNLTPLHYSRGTIWLALALVAAVSYGSMLLPGPRRRVAELFSPGRGQWRLVLVSEILFLAFFGLFWIIRWGNPDLWHPWKGGEKPMDLAYLNAVIKSTEFPPYDPWFAGGYLNYYYFGQVMVGTLIKLVGIAPAVAYNLVVPAWFAMTAMGAFSVTYNLYRTRAEGRGVGGPLDVRRIGSRAILVGLLGALFVAVLGNLGEIHLLLLKVAQGVLDNFSSTIPGLAGLVRATVGTFEVLFGGKALPIGLDEWYWNASRAIPAGPYEAVITEFPFFTFLYADLHAHLIAMPLTFLSLALALTVVQRAALPVRGADNQARPAWWNLLTHLALLFLWALIIGAMRTTNTWDVPPHLIVAFGALAIATAQRPRRFPLLILAGQLLILVALSWWLLYWPFWEHYGSFYNSLGLWNGTRTPVWAYLVVHGLFLFPIASYLAARTLGNWRYIPVLRRLGLSLRYAGQGKRLRRVARIAGARGPLRSTPGLCPLRSAPGLCLPAGPLPWIAIVLLLLAVVFFLIPGLIEFTRADPLVAESGSHAYRGLAVLGLGLPLAIMGLILLFRAPASHAGTREGSISPQRYVAPVERLWAWLVLLALAMSLGVEVLVLEGDIGRMNTVFKFYLQVWIMWGVAAAAAVGWMVPRLRRWGSTVRGTAGEADEDGAGGTARRWWVAVLVALVAFAALYPPLATSAKVRDRWNEDQPPGLDGWEYMETGNYWDPVGAEFGHDGGVRYDLRWDREAIAWLLDNVVGSPTILEGQTPEYRWGGRYAVNTGLPTVLGWNWHQRQQRAAADQQAIWDRAQDVATIYNVPGTMVAEDLLQKYGVRYVIVGPLEQAYYDPLGLEKFERMAGEGTLRRVFRNQGVTIYEVLLGR